MRSSATDGGSASGARTGRRDWLLQSVKAAGLVGIAGTPWLAHAASAKWPTRPIRLIVPFATGGSTDIVARLVAPGISEEIGQQLVVENHGGAGGTIGAQAIARAQNDGHAIGMSTVSILGTAPAVYRDIKYDGAKDFTAIIKLVDVPGVVTVHPSFAGQDYESFMKELRAHPDQYNYASAGQGSIGHMAMELFKQKTGVKMTHIPYKGSGPALNDLLGGQVKIMWDNLSSSLPHIQGGKLTAIGLNFDRRIDQLPKVPTFAELGVNEFDATTWFGLIGPKGMPQEVVQRINEAANKVIRRPELAKKLIETGAYPAGGDAASADKVIHEELAKWREVAKIAKIEL